MAEQIAHDVVKEAQSMGGPSPIDDTATSTSTPAGNGETPPERTNVLSKPSQTQHTTITNATNSEAADGETSQSFDQADGAVASTTLNSTGQAHINSMSKDTHTQLVNGDAGDQSASDDGASQNALGEMSGGSDTDISRPGSVDPLKERPGGHFRSNSMKKPASFKSVSVTKNFLAKSAVSIPVVRPGEKVPPTGQTAASNLLAAKPRLVAKSGGGSNVSRTLSKTNGAGAGPDGSKVWNKNQPVPLPPPKQFTDEELKQQYGIHLATRLQADEGGKEAKWADIDDDEDDWTPEAVQWMDGTKSSLTAAENQPPPPPEEPTPVPKKEVQPPAVPIEATAPISAPTPAAPTATPTSSQRPGSTGGTKTILKPGAHVQAGSKAGLVLKGQPEKPTLVAKPSGSMPVKSPWAVLPPVEKVSPVQINPPAPQQAAPRFTQRDSHGYDAPPPPAAAKEIAPDDFNRSWRDERVNRELFNSHSGRYEPVNDTRRGSNRDNFRHQPAVLQRPHDGPAEPSAAFQTSRTSADAPVWGRRRNSSNVSGGSGRRMSNDRMPPMLSNVPRRGSQSINGVEPLGTPRQAFPTVPEQHPVFAQEASPNLSIVQPASPYGSVSSAGHTGTANNADGAAHHGPPVPAENPVEVQNRLMREKLERARLQKQKEREQEQKEEDERKERLRKKLEAMGLTDDSKTKPKEPSPSRPPRPADKSPVKDRAVPVAVQSPPKPPVPTSEGEVAQYGMMKVHQPHPVRRQHPSEAAPSKISRNHNIDVSATAATSKPGASPVKAFASVSGEVQPKLAGAGAPTSFTSSPPEPPSITSPADGRPNKLSIEQSQASTHQSEDPVRAGAASTSTLKTSQPPVATWSNNNLAAQPQSRPWGANVWGPPQAKDRALGNGTFDSEYVRGQRPASQQLPPQPTAAPPPSLGLTSQLKPAPPQPQAASAPPFNQPIFIKPEMASAPQVTAMPKPGPIAPPVNKGWGNFHTSIVNDDRSLATQSRENKDRLGGAYRPEMRERYKVVRGQAQDVTLHDQLGHIGINKPDSNTEAVQAPTDSKTNDDVTKPATEANPTPSTVGQSATHHQTNSQTARPSRFFPRTAEPIVQSSTEANADSPPPPETESHPAFAGDSIHPIVKMPKPSPRVKLPPTAAETPTQEAPVSMPSRQRMGLGARPLALDPEWQARFNSLLEKPNSGHPLIPSTRPVAGAQSTNPATSADLTITASSRAPLEDRTSIGSATVSLPKKLFADDVSSEVTTRVSAEEALLDDREFGSLPVVRLSKTSHLAANEPPAPFPPTYYPHNRPRTLVYRPLEPQSKACLDTLFFHEETSDGRMKARVHLGNMHEPVLKALPVKREIRKVTNYKGPKRNYSATTGPPNSTDTRAPKKSTSYPRQNSNSNSNSSRPSGSGAWGSSRPTTTHSNSGNTSNTTPWARRAGPPPAPVH